MTLLLVLALIAVALTYMIKFYKYQEMAEKEFIKYQTMLEDEITKRKEEEYLHESEIHLYKEEHGELKEEREKTKFERERLKQSLVHDGGNLDLRLVLQKIDQMQQEKEDEMIKRLDLEKKLELILQRNQEIEQKAEDIKAIQEENINIIKKVAAILYKKISADINSIK